MNDCNLGSETDGFFGQEDDFDFNNESESGSSEIPVVKKRQKGFNKDGKLRKERYYGRYKYVYWNPSLQKYKASIVTNKKTRVLGTFETEEEAASEINKRCIALSIPLKNPSICFEKPETALRYMKLKVSQVYDGVLYLPSINKYVGYLFVHKDEEAKLFAVKKRRRSKSKNGSKLALYQDQYKFTGFASTEIAAAQNINNYCVRELNIPPKFPGFSVYSRSSMRHKKTARRFSRQKQILSLGFDDGTVSEDEDLAIVCRKSYCLRKRKLYRRPNYVDYTLFDEMELENHFSQEPAYKKRKLNIVESLKMCDFTKVSLPTKTATPTNSFDFIATPLISKSIDTNETNSSAATTMNTSNTPPPKAKKMMEPLPCRSPSVQIAAQQQKKLEQENNETHLTHSSNEEIISEVDSDSTKDSDMLFQIDEDEELTGEDALSQYLRWDSHRNCWIVRIPHHGNQFFVGNFNSKKHAINALIDYSKKLSIPLSDYIYSLGNGAFVDQVEETIGSPNYYTTDSDNNSAVSEDEVMEDKNNSNNNHWVEICSPSYPVSMELWTLAELCISRGKQQNYSSEEFVSF